MKIIVVLLGSALYWQLVSGVTGAAEPWDATTYWRVWYPISFGLAALAGMFFGKRGWIAGTVVTLVQLPVMWLNSGTGSLWVAGLMTLCVLAMPVAATSALTGWLAARARSR